MDLDAQFQHAKSQVKTLTEKPSNDILLKLYALYKQGSTGDINIDAPGVFDFVAKAKYNAWEALKNTSKDDAKQQYIDLVNSLLTNA